LIRTIWLRFLTHVGLTTCGQGVVHKRRYNAIGK
jgi:hypothetical protein